MCVCVFKLALYGHTDSRGFCEEEPYSCGCEPVQDQRGLFYKPKEDASTMIYVDDIKMSCKEPHRDRLCAQLRERILLSPYTMSDRYLGCYSRRFSAPISRFAPIISNLTTQWSRADNQGQKSVEAKERRPAGPQKAVTGYAFEMHVYYTSAHSSTVTAKSDGAGGEALKPTQTLLLVEATRRVGR